MRRLTSTTCPEICVRPLCLCTWFFDKAFFQFKSFALGEWSLIRHDMIRAGIQQGKTGSSAQIFAYLLMASLAETGLRSKARKIQESIVAMLGGPEPERHVPEDEFSQRFWMEWLRKPPILGDLTSTAVYRSSPIPALQSLVKAPSGVKQAFAGEKAVTRMRGLVTALEGAIGLFVGLPGTAQAARLARLALADKRLRFPFSAERSELRRAVKDGSAAREDALRLRRLDILHRGAFTRANREFGRAMDRSDSDGARVAVEAWRKELQKFK